MSRSSREFNRWKPHDRSTWAFQVYRKYNRELYQIIEAHRIASFFTYQQLGKAGAKWENKPETSFSGYKPNLDNFDTIKDWSSGFNSFDNWVNLSNITTIASNVETYLASVVALSIASDPSVLIGAPSHSLDGAYVLKHRAVRPVGAMDHVIACTKGDWSSRLAAFERLFGPAPTDMRVHHSALEEIRNIRNRFSNAFGREIEASREHGQREVILIDKVGRSSVTRLGRAAWKFVQATDNFLLHSHIGDFEAVNYYAKMFPTQLHHVPPGQRAANLKKAIGTFGAGLRGKRYCNGLVNYWESL